MDGWDSWTAPSTPSDRQRINDALAAARAATQHEQYREVVWDRGMPQESRERITRNDPRWDQAE